jgi:hypothetical protein
VALWIKAGQIARRGKAIVVKNAPDKSRTKNEHAIEGAIEIQNLSGRTVRAPKTTAVTAPVTGDVPIARPGIVRANGADKSADKSPTVSAVYAHVLPTPPVEQGLDGWDLWGYAAAVGLAIVAALFSLRGLQVLFPATPTAIVAFGLTLEASKLVTAGYVGAKWRAMFWLWRYLLVLLVIGLMCINAAGLFSQLVASHLGDRGAAVASIDARAATLQAQLDQHEATIADLGRQLDQIDAGIKAATDKGKATTGINAMEGQRKHRADVAEAKNREAVTYANIKGELAEVTAQGHRVQAEALPLRYVTEVLGLGADDERSIRWLILLMVLCTDPLAVVLTAAVSSRRRG